MQGYCSCLHRRAQPLRHLGAAQRNVSVKRKTIPLEDGVAAAKQMLVKTGDLMASTLQLYFSDWDAFVGFAAAEGASSASDVDRQLVARFLTARDRSGGVPSNASQHRRRNSARSLFRSLRALELVRPEHDPTADLPLPPRSSLEIRALTDDEINACRWAARADFQSSRYPALWALAEAGGTMTEIANVMVSDVDLDDERVLFGGTYRTRARNVHLTEWGLKRLGKHLQACTGAPSARLLYTGPDSTRRSTVTNALRRIYAGAGLDGERDVKPESIRAWLGKSMRAQGDPIEKVARRLGMSLDNAMEFVGEGDWVEVED